MPFSETGFDFSGSKILFNETLKSIFIFLFLSLNLHVVLWIISNAKLTGNGNKFPFPINFSVIFSRNLFVPILVPSYNRVICRKSFLLIIIFYV